MTAIESILPPAPPRDPSWPAILPPVLSPTSLTTFQCPEAWRRVYLQGEWSRPDGALVIGGADSEAAAHNYGQKIDSHEDLPVADVELFAAEAFDQRLATEDVEWKDRPGEATPGEAKDTTIRVVRAYHQAVAPRVQPLTVEAEVTLAVEGVAPLVRAYVDLTTAGRVISRKTSAKKVSAPKQGWLNQSAIESAATGLPTDYHVTVKPTGHVLIPAELPALVGHTDGLAAERAARFVTTTTRAILALLTEFGPDEPWPQTAALHPYAATCSFCNFRERGCPAWL